MDGFYTYVEYQAEVHILNLYLQKLEGAFHVPKEGNLIPEEAA